MEFDNNSYHHGLNFPDEQGQGRIFTAQFTKFILWVLRSKKSTYIKEKKSDKDFKYNFLQLGIFWYPLFRLVFYFVLMTID